MLMNMIGKKPELRLAGLLLSLTVLAAAPARAAPGDVLFSDDFEDGSLSPWSASSGSRVGVNEDTAQSGSHSMFLRHGTAESTSPVIDASGIPGADLSFWVRRGDDAFSEDPDFFEDLTLRYRDNDGNWQELATWAGSGTPGEVFSDTVPLPADARHANLRLRFELQSGSGSDFDYWHVDDVVVREDGIYCDATSTFRDSFEDGALDAWKAKSTGPNQGDAGVDQRTAGDGSRSAFVGEDPITLESPKIDLKNTTSAELSVWIRRGADSFSEYPEGGDNVVLEYRRASGPNQWVELDTFNGGGVPGEIFEPSYSLPADARHKNFRFRLRMEGGSGPGFDYWHLDNVCLTVSGAGVDHFALAHDGAGINCRAEDVVLRAEDASGNLVTDYTDSVDLSTTTNNGDWAIGTGNGSLSGGGGDDGSATYTFADADDGEVTLAFSDTHAETLNIDATDGSATDDDTEGDITFRPWGFESTPDPIPTQIAGRPFDLTLTAVGELPSDPGCNVIEEYDGDRDLAFWFDYEDPGSGTVDVTVDGTPIATSESGATDQTIAFSNGEATVPVDYRDAGEIQLHAQDDDGVGEPPAGSGDELVSGGVIGGGTNPFVVRPFGFYVDFDPDGDGTFDDRGANAGCGGQTSCAADAGGDVFATADADFSARIAAVVWQSADDGNGDGRPDGNAMLADNAETPNFGQEASAETVDLADTLVAPSPGTAGSLANGSGIGGFSGGARTLTDLRYSEVGIIDLDAALSDGAYLGTVDVTGGIDDVGRFIPADFLVEVREAGMYAATCNSGAPPAFTYVGQAFGYDMRPRLDITARNAGGATTENYRDGFIKLSGADVDVAAPTSDASAIGNVSGTTDVAVTPSLNTGAIADDGDGDALGNGVLVYTFDSGDRYTYDKVHNARIPVPSQAPTITTDLPITLDDVTDADAVSDGELPSPNPFTPTGVQIRFGRLVIDDAFGPEIAPVEQRWRIEYWQGSNWATNMADGCTSLALDSDVELTGDGGTSPGDATVTLNDSGGTGTTAIVDNALDVSGGSIVFTGGVANVRYSAPGEGERGWIGAASILGANHHLLVDDNDDGGNDGPYDTNPGARVTFGVFAGESENIYLREVFPAP